METIITITIKGGNVQDVDGVPAGVTVQIIDYDNHGPDKDYAGKPCSIEIHKGE
jgi:hypothetical protein